MSKEDFLKVAKKLMHAAPDRKTSVQKKAAGYSDTPAHPHTSGGAASKQKRASHG